MKLGNGTFRYRIPPESIPGALSFLSGLGFRLYRHENAVGAKIEGVSLQIYDSGIVLGSGKGMYVRTVIDYFENLPFDYGAFFEEVTGKKMPEKWCCSDEAGKGDYFGPLVVAGVCVNSDIAAHLYRYGVADSKLLPHSELERLNRVVRELIGPSAYDILVVNPKRYNEMHASMGTVNNILIWAHSRIISSLLENNGFSVAVVDRFGTSAQMAAISSRVKGVSIIDLPHGERETGVAAASILASWTFLNELCKLSEKVGTELPPGAGPEARAVARSIRGMGERIYSSVAKTDFKL